MPLAGDAAQNARNAVGEETTPVSVRDSDTGAVVPNVGDASNKAVRVNVVAGGGGGTADVNPAVVDDGTVPVPAVGTRTQERLDPDSHGIIVGPVTPGTAPTQLGKTLGQAVDSDTPDTAVPVLFSVNTEALGLRWQPGNLDPNGSGGILVNIVNAAPIPITGAIGPVTPGTDAANLGKADGEALVADAVGMLLLGRNQVDNKYRAINAMRGDEASTNDELGFLVFGRDVDDGSFAPIPLKFVSSAGETAVPVLVTDQFVKAQLGPFLANNDFFSSAVAGVPQKSLSVCLTADGTVVAASMAIYVRDSFGNESAAVITLTQADLNILKGVTSVIPFQQIRAVLTGLTLGTATELTLYVTTSP